jgi:hypothetical protein
MGEDCTVYKFTIRFIVVIQRWNFIGMSVKWQQYIDAVCCPGGVILKSCIIIQSTIGFLYSAQIAKGCCSMALYNKFEKLS